jgi:hypothetical protein
MLLIDRGNSLPYTSRRRHILKYQEGLTTTEKECPPDEVDQILVINLARLCRFQECKRGCKVKDATIKRPMDA